MVIEPLGNEEHVRSFAKQREVAMKGLGYLIAAAVAVLASPVSADETWTNVEYLRGKASFSRYMKGTLTLTAKELRFVDKKT